jgi:DNA repair exonuclease SbcCD ATPase subunit
MKSLKYLLMAMILPAFIISCNQKKVEKLESERTRLQADSISKDSLLNDWLTTFNEIEDNLSEITGHQKFIANAANSENRRNPDVRDRIRKEIAMINDIMIENKDKLESLQKQLKSNNLKIKALEETITILSKRVEEKDMEIADLKDQLGKLNIEKENLNKTVAQLQEDAAKKEEVIAKQQETIDQLNTVWYIVNTNKYLEENGILEKSGKLGGGKVLSDNVATGKFKQADLRNISTININSDKAKLITTHDKDSYEFVKKDKVITHLQIKDQAEFWKTSKFCVIEIK